MQFKSELSLQPDEQIVIPGPSVARVVKDDKLEFMVLATDGVWHEIYNQDLVNFILKQMDNEMPLNKICSRILEMLGDKDNRTLIIVVTLLLYCQFHATTVITAANSPVDALIVDAR